MTLFITIKREEGKRKSGKKRRNEEDEEIPLTELFIRATVESRTYTPCTSNICAGF